MHRRLQSAAAAMIALSIFLLCLNAALNASCAWAQGSESRILDLMQRLRVERASSEEARVGRLHDTYLNATVADDKRIIALALGEHYLQSNARIALQYLSSAESACRGDDPLLPIILYYKGEAKRRLGAFREASEIAQKLLDSQHLSSSWSKKLYGLLIESHYAAGDWEKMVAAFQGYSKRYSFNRRQEYLAKLAAQAFEKQGNITKATEVIEELARGYPTTEASRWAFRRLADFACSKNGERPRYYYSQRLLQHLSRNILLDNGIEDFIVAAISQPIRLQNNQIRVLSRVERADLLFRARLYQPALAETMAIYEEKKSSDDSRSLPSLIFEIGRIHMRLGDHITATRWFSHFLARWAKHPNVPRAYEYLGDAFRYLDMPAVASEYYSLAATRSDSKLMRWFHFWTNFRAKNYLAALKLLKTPGYVQPREGDEEATVTYWHAKVLQKLGKQTEANALYEQVLASSADSFYANLIAVQRPDLAKTATIVAQAKTQTSAAVLGAEAELTENHTGSRLAAKILDSGYDHSVVAASPELRVIDELLRFGMRDTASTQLTSVRWSDYSQPETFAAASRLAMTLHDYAPARRIRFSSFSSLRRMPSSWREYIDHQIRNVEEWQIYYPLAFNKIVDSVASGLRFNKYLILSIMRAESFYNKDARSGVGAQGLMQLMPYTALNIARLLRDDSFDVLDIADPQINISYGAYYIDKLVRYYGGNPYLAVAAYNGGPVNVNQWLDSCGDCSSDEFVEAIPFRETRRYVRHVMSNLAQYSRIYDGQPTLADLPKMPEHLPEGEEIF